MNFIQYVIMLICASVNDPCTAKKPTTAIVKNCMILNAKLNTTDLKYISADDMITWTLNVILSNNENIQIFYDTDGIVFRNDYDDKISINDDIFKILWDTGIMVEFIAQCNKFIIDSMHKELAHGTISVSCDAIIPM